MKFQRKSETYPRPLPTSWSMTLLLTHTWLWTIPIVTIVLSAAVAIIEMLQGGWTTVLVINLFSIAGLGQVMGVVATVGVTLRGLNMIQAGSTRGMLARALPVSYLLLSFAALPSMLLPWFMVLAAKPGTFILDSGNSAHSLAFGLMPLYWLAGSLALFLTIGLGTLLYKRSPRLLIVGAIVLFAFLNYIIEATSQFGVIGKTVMFFLPNPNMLGDVEWGSQALSHAGWLLLAPGLLWVLLRRWEPSR